MPVVHRGKCACSRNSLVHAMVYCHHLCARPCSRSEKHSSKQTEKNLCPRGAYIRVREMDNKLVTIISRVLVSECCGKIKQRRGKACRRSLCDVLFGGFHKTCFPRGRREDEPSTHPCADWGTRSLSWALESQRGRGVWSREWGEGWPGLVWGRWERAVQQPRKPGVRACWGGVPGWVSAL